MTSRRSFLQALLGAACVPALMRDMKPMPLVVQLPRAMQSYRSPHEQAVMDACMRCYQLTAIPWAHQ